MAASPVSDTFPLPPVPTKSNFIKKNGYPNGDMYKERLKPEPELRCGYWGCRPDSLQKLNNPKALLAFLCFFSMAQGMSSNVLPKSHALILTDDLECFGVIWIRSGYPLVTGYSFNSKWFSIMYSMDTAWLAKRTPANLSRFTVNSDQCLLNTWLQSKTSLTLTVTEEYLELYCNNLLKSDTVTDCYYLGTHISNIKVKLSNCRT